MNWLIRLVLWLCAALANLAWAEAQVCDERLPDTAPTERFRDNEDGTVTDRATKLTWMRCSLGQRWHQGDCLADRDWFTHHSWDQAVRGAARADYAGYRDWRLPTLFELRSLVQRRCRNPAINAQVFPRTVAHAYWTLTDFETNADYAYRINFLDGAENADLKESPSYRARLVRGQPPRLTAPKVFGAGTVRPRIRNSFAEDGIHDMDNPGIQWLQDPREALAGFERNRWGRVDWMGVLRAGRIEPRADLRGETSMQVLDLDVLMKDTREMDWVLFPHESHTQWLACENCHPQPFPYKSGLVDISMDDILLGRYCGLCHGRVSFSTMLCDRCHSVAPTVQGANR